MLINEWRWLTGWKNTFHNVSFTLEWEGPYKFSIRFAFMGFELRTPHMRYKKRSIHLPDPEDIFRTIKGGSE